jgi:hypothetical protein
VTQQKSFLRDNGLLLAFTALFLLCLYGQVWSGCLSHNAALAEHQQAPLDQWQYVHTGVFLQGIFSNWQAAILQLGTLIVFAVFLRQRGAAHSLQPDESTAHVNAKNQAKALGKTTRPEPRRDAKDGPQRKRRLTSKRPAGPRRSWWFRNSLSLAFGILFLVSFVFHLLSGAAAYNSQQALSHEATMTVSQYFGSAHFWFTTMQCWEAEFMAIALYIGLSIFLRQEGSPESKRADASNSETGGPNE